jgi:hypothetical protein
MFMTGKNARGNIVVSIIRATTIWPTGRCIGEMTGSLWNAFANVVLAILIPTTSHIKKG